ncbi:MAG: C40 family peptidase [Nodosilinea sp.]
MGTFSGLESSPAAVEVASLTYVCRTNLNLYKTPDLQGLVTQAAPGRYLQVLTPLPAGLAAPSALEVRLCEDDYPGWIRAIDRANLAPVLAPYQPVPLDRTAIADRLPQAIAFAQNAMVQPNTYLWGGTVGPNFDCSGLVQTAFAAAGIALPRDSYQQEAFTQSIEWSELLPGDLVFFGTSERTKHVGLYLGEGWYIHSSGREQGRNGIGLDSLTDLSHPVSRTYHHQRRRPGRVMTSYCPRAL